MRNYLRRAGKRRFNPGTRASMLFLNLTDPRAVKLVRTADDRLGLPGAARAYHLFERPGRSADPQPPVTTGGPPLRAQVIHFINKPMPGKLPKKTARALLDIEDPRSCRSSAIPRK